MELPIDRVSKNFVEVAKGAQRLANVVQLVIKIGSRLYHEDADHDASWMLSSLKAHSTFARERVWAAVHRDVVDS